MAKERLTRPGYEVTFRAFLPMSPKDPNGIAGMMQIISESANRLQADLQAHVTVEQKYVAKKPVEPAASAPENADG